MCGIAGFARGDDDEIIARRLTERLRHRGPDRQWYELTNSYGLIQTRLSVIDLSDRVTYPIRNESEELVLLFNGEIYDHAHHRSVLERRGHVFRTRCDAEVVVHGYEEFGDDFFARIDGMFALALLHLPSGQLVLVRDAIGVKPLVYSVSGRFAFASDALSLVAVGLSAGIPDEQAIAAFLACHYVPPPLTALTDLRQVLPGELVRRDVRGNVSRERWCSHPFSEPRRGEPPTQAELAHALDASVRSQLAADVPVGVFLSSGLDSSLVLDSAVRAGANPTAFTISFPDQPNYDEAEVAGRFARQLGVRHVVDHLSLGFAEVLAEVAAAFDAPFADASAIATLQLARLARGEVTVALSGTGGDDLFAGYYRHRAHLLQPLVGRVPGVGLRLIRHLAMGYGTGSRSALGVAKNYAARLAAAHADLPLEQYVRLVTSLSSPALLSLFRIPVPDPGDVLGVVAKSKPEVLLRRIQEVEMSTYLAGDLLPKEDRATMAVGLEGRVPLLSAEMVALAERAKDSQKISLRSGKLLLRELARQRLPPYLTSRRKRGFGVPLRDLLAGAWRNDAVEWLASDDSDFADRGQAAERARRGELPPTDLWALASFLSWEGRLRSARAARSGVAV